MFKTGDKVVCIKKGLWTNELEDAAWGIVFPKKDKEYIIRNFYDASTGLHLRFEEIDNGHIPTLEGGEIGFHHSRFRKLDYEFVEETLKNLKPETHPMLDDLFNNVFPRITEDYKRRNNIK